MGTCDDCRVLNMHTHNRPVDNCHDCCCMGCGYCTPIGVAVLVVALVGAAMAYYIILMKDFPDAWRIVVCILFILLTMALGAGVLWSFYQVIFTPPGFVEEDPWRFRPVYLPDDAGMAATAEEAAHATGRDGGGRAHGTPPEGHARTLPPASHPPREAADEANGDSDNPLLTGGGPNTAYSTASQDVEVPVKEDVSGSHGPRRHTHSPYDPPPPPAATTSAAPPDTPPPQAEPEPGPQRNPYIVRQLDRSGGLRFCKHCNIYKPDHAYHCHVSKRCVYDFDHFCGFLSSSIGRNNYRLFIIFLLYGAVGCFVAAIPMVIAIFAMDKHDIMDKIGWIAVPAVMLILALSLGLFFVEHRCMMCEGVSSVDKMVQQRRREERMYERGFVPWSAKRKAFDAKHRTPELTREQRAARAALKKERADARKRELWGTETGWRAYLPYPIRTDNTADGIPHV